VLFFRCFFSAGETDDWWHHGSTHLGWPQGQGTRASWASWRPSTESCGILSWMVYAYIQFSLGLANCDHCVLVVFHISILILYIYISIYLHVGMQLYNMLIQGPYMNPPHLQSEDSVPETVHHVVLYIDPCPFVAEAKKVWSPTFEDHPIQIYIYILIYYISWG
jgi:hypothetical protein